MHSEILRSNLKQNLCKFKCHIKYSNLIFSIQTNFFLSFADIKKSCCLNICQKHNVFNYDVDIFKIFNIYLFYAFVQTINPKTNSLTFYVSRCENSRIRVQVSLRIFFSPMCHKAQRKK